jgi:ketosteroid isomerase-like protein
MRATGLLPAALLLLACSHTPPAPHPVPARGPARDSLLASDFGRTHAVQARGVVGGFAESLTPDVLYLRAGTPAVRGLDATRMLLADTARVPGAVAWQPEGGDISADHASGYTYGIAVRVLGADSVGVERYIAFWRRAPGGPWRIAAYVEVGSPFRSPPSAQSATSPLANAPSRGTAELMAADSAFSDLADRVGVGNAFAATVAPHGVIFAGSEIVTGPKAVRDFYAAGDAASGLAWHPTFAEAAASGDLGFTVGQYIFTGRGASGAAIQSFGKYLTVWQRQPDGSWKFVVDGGNANPAPRAELRR